MKKYNVGDRVRLTHNTLDDWHVTGETGVIEDIDVFTFPRMGVTGELQTHEYGIRFDTSDRSGEHFCCAADDILEPENA